MESVYCVVGSNVYAFLEIVFLLFARSVIVPFSFFFYIDSLFGFQQLPSHFRSAVISKYFDISSTVGSIILSVTLLQVLIDISFSCNILLINVGFF